MKYPILYEANATDFFSLGIGVLTNALNVEVTEERNGEFFLEGSFLIDDELFPLLKEDRILRTDAGHTLKDQRFRIKRIVPKSDNIATVYAEHISYITQELSLKPEVSIHNMSGSGALNVWKNSIIDKHPLTIDSDVKTMSSANWRITEVDNARLALGGIEGSVLDRWGGEFRFDNYHISLKEKRGKNSSALLAYGRNITDFEQERNIMNTYTSVYPYAVYLDDKQREHLVTVDNYIIDSQHVDKFPNRKALPVDFSSEFDEKNRPTKAKLVKLAEKYIKDNEVGVPLVSIKVSFVDLSKTLEYKELAPLEELEVCDNVKIVYEKLGINTTAKVVKTVWDVLGEKYNEIEIGEKRVTLGDAISTQNTIINKVEKTSNSALVSANGKNMNFYGIDEPTATKVGDTWYKPDGEETEMYVWNGTIWEFVMSTKDGDVIKGEIDKLEKEVADQKESIDTALENAENSLTIAEQARKDAFDSKEIAEQAQKDINEAQESIAEAKDSAGKALEEATNTKAELITINGKVEQQGLTINKLDDELQVQSAKVNANSTSVASLKLESDRIVTEVVKTNQKVDNIQIGGRNYFSKNEENYISDGTYMYREMPKGVKHFSIEPKKEHIEKKSVYVGFTTTGKNADVQVIWGIRQGVLLENKREIDHLNFISVYPKTQESLDWLYDNYLIKFEIGNRYTDWTLAPEDYAEQSQVTKLSTKIDQTAESVKIKADKSEVDTINKTVKENKAQIEVHNQQIQLKANQSEVDAINDTVKLHESEIKLNSEQIKLKVDKTEHDALTGKVNKNTSDITMLNDQINLVVSEGVEGASPNLFNDSRAMYYEEDNPWSTPGGITKKLTKELEGTQYLKLQWGDVNRVVESRFRSNRFTTPEISNNISFSARIYAPKEVTVKIKWTVWGRRESVIDEEVKLKKGWNILVKNSVPSELPWAVSIGIGCNVSNTVIYFDWVTANYGDVSSQWSLHSDEIVKQSQITILKDQINLRVTKDEFNALDDKVVKQESRITLLSNQINLSVKKGDAIGQINVEAGKVLIRANDNVLMITPNTTYIQNATIKTAMIADASITNAKIQDASISNAKIISLDANKIVANELNAITTNTGDLNVTGWLDIKTQNNGIRGEFDYGDDPVVQYARWHEGNFRLSHRHLIFGGTQWTLHSNGDKQSWHGKGESFYGANYFKSRWYGDYFNQDKLTGRIDIRDDFIQVADAFGDNTGAFIKPNLIISDNYEASHIRPREGRSNLYFNYTKTGQTAIIDGDLRIGNDGNKAIVQSDAIYNRTYNWTGGNVTVTDSGALGRATSASKYKMNIDVIPNELEYAKQILNVKPKKWFDKESMKIYNLNIEKGMNLEDYYIGEIYGLIAEDVEEAGLSKYCQYNTKTGEIEGISYDKLTTLLIPLVKDLYERIEVLENKNA